MKTISAASCGTVYTTRIPDHATVIVTALERIFDSSAPVWERRQAAIAYVRDELADVERQAADRWPGENFHPQLDLLDPLTSADSLWGLAVKPPNACRKCGDPVATVGPGKPPHSASLRCRSCDLHRGWVSRAHCAYLNEVIATGVPREPIVLHTSTSKPERATTESASLTTVA
jgi:hypothetical protein